MATLQDYLGITKLRDAWPKWKANLIAVNNQVMTHIAGTADKHASQDITYTGGFAGKTEVNAALDQAKTEIDTIVVSASIDPEVAFARESLVKGETFATLDARLEESEQDLVTYSAENVTQLAAKVDKVVGKGLSTNDYDDIEKGEVAKVASKADTAYVDTQIAAVTDGTPKAVYATLVALQTAFPTGTAGIYLVTADGKWYYWNGSAWTAGGTYQATGIANGAVTPIMNANAPINIIPSAKMPTFTPSTIQSSSSTITVNFKNGQMLVDSNKGYVTCSSDFSIDVANGYYLVLTWITGGGKLSITQLETITRTALVPAYNKYVLFYNGNGRLYSPISAYDLLLEKTYSSLLNFENTIIVAKSGGDYDTIQGAIDSFYPYPTDSETTIMVMPGVYEEAIDTKGRYISMVGVSKKDCILINNSGNYDTPPLNIDAPIYVEDMTIIATHDGSVEVDKSLWKSYAVHCDNNASGKYEFFNCILESDNMAAIGIGLGQDQTLKLRNCELISHTDADSPWVNHGALYAHNDLQVSTEQHLIVDNCRIISDNGKAMYIDDVGTGGSIMDASFYGNMLYSKTLGKTDIVQVTTPVTAGKFSGTSITLNVKSYGNNLAELNA